MCSLAPIVAEQFPWKTIFKNLEDHIPIEMKTQLTSQCHKLRSALESNETMEQNLIDDSLLRLEACLDQTWETLNTGYWKDVSINYRYSYTLASVIKCIFLEIECSADGESRNEVKKKKLIEIIEQIDKAILLGAPLPSAPHLMTTIASRLNNFIAHSTKSEANEILINDNEITMELLDRFEWIKRFEKPSMETFYRDIFKPKSPALLENCLGHWKALKSWKNLDYLIKIAGNRTVPIEIGSRYTEEDWSQSLVSFAEFLQTHVSKKNDKIGYLAQHQLFEQIPEMKEDFSIPDYCNFSDTDEDPDPPDINAWFGPRGTVSPLHFDPKNNLLCQVIGYKRLIVYHPEESTNLYSYESRLLSNTAQVDPLNPDFDRWPKFKEAKGFMSYLKPGDMAFIPPGWWHHVESLTPSFSISFWWC
ncbi:bifunctional peptidase and arginyl-hydroxylase JMJD5 isoform X2 [Venturia canescens]|uniref:bifunctional peptidase and arginyl-hydroxylase JMJD5 isoform X2 n=1 Tax=Venturia canescens TaxID=32260 RepID=UPI001C9CC63F|nr:bifunctional peptidase and arginyl-hydroxylase JMJD5 isoform X2 [Venturia canescens]